MTCIVIKNCIYADNIPTVLILTGQMPEEIIIRQWRKLTVRAFKALLFLLVTELRIPFILTYRLIPSLAGGYIVPSACKYIFTPFEWTRSTSPPGTVARSL